MKFRCWRLVALVYQLSDVQVEITKCCCTHIYPRKAGWLRKEKLFFSPLTFSLHSHRDISLYCTPQEDIHQYLIWVELGHLHIIAMAATGQGRETALNWSWIIFWYWIERPYLIFPESKGFFFFFFLLKKGRMSHAASHLEVSRVWLWKVNQPTFSYKLILRACL